MRQIKQGNCSDSETFDTESSGVIANGSNFTDTVFGTSNPITLDHLGLLLVSSSVGQNFLYTPLEDG